MATEWIEKPHRTQATGTDPGRWVPGVLRCACGAEHGLQRGDSACDCGQLYNASGQALVPPSQWEEEAEPDEWVKGDSW